MKPNDNPQSQDPDEADNTAGAGCMARLVRLLFLRRSTESPLKIELRNLERRIRETADYMQETEREFWEQGGICCPGCGIRGWSELEDKQARRRERVKQIHNKL